MARRAASAAVWTWRAIASASATTSTSPIRCPHSSPSCEPTPIRRWPGSPIAGKKPWVAAAVIPTICRRAGQTKPTPLLLHYEAGGYNCLHQDLYGEVAFPLQITAFLSRRGVDYEGGEFLLVEQRPRAQSRGQAIATEQGELVIFTTRERPARVQRGWYRATMRHGVSRLTSGTRYTLGVIFHDAK